MRDTTHPLIGRAGRRCMEVIRRTAATDRTLGYKGGEVTVLRPRGASLQGRGAAGRSGADCGLA